MRYTLLLLLCCTCTTPARPQQPAFGDLFPHLAPGKPLKTRAEPLVPNADTGEPFFRATDEYPAGRAQEESAQGVTHHICPVGKIPGYRGTGLDIFDTEFTRPDEDSDDNHVSGLSYQAFVRDGKLQTEDDGELLQLIGLSGQYMSEGGQTAYDIRIASGTTLLCSTRNSAQESATEYQPPIVTIGLMQQRLLPEEGSTQLIEVLQAEFPSPFFEAKTVAKLTARNDKTGYPDSPADEREYRLRFSARDEMPGNGPGLCFHLTDTSVVVLTRHGDEQFIDSCIPSDEDFIDDYILSREDAALAAQCPVITRTSDGILHVSPDGGLRLEK